MRETEKDEFSNSGMGKEHAYPRAGGRLEDDDGKPEASGRGGGATGEGASPFFLIMFHRSCPALLPSRPKRSTRFRADGAKIKWLLLFLRRRSQMATACSVPGLSAPRAACRGLTYGAEREQARGNPKI